VSEPLTPGELAALPVFPLPRVVFFPHTQLPLHVFEPRYRAMMEDCLAKGPRAMAVALLLPGYERDYEGRPPIATVAGAGRIVAHERLPDGRFNLILEGVARVHLAELPADGLPYRRARATVLDGSRGAEKVPRATLAALMQTSSLVAAEVRRRQGHFELGVAADDRADVVVDVIADRLVSDAGVRQRILETLDPTARAQLTLDAVTELLVMLGGSGPKGRACH
jgi:Lon protease-like protein